MKTKSYRIVVTFFTAAFGLASLALMSSCATDQGHGHQGYHDSHSAVEPAWKRAVQRGYRR